MWTRLNEEADEDWVRNCRSLKHDFSNKGARGNASILGLYLVILSLLYNRPWMQMRLDEEAD